MLEAPSNDNTTTSSNNITSALDEKKIRTLKDAYNEMVNRGVSISEKRPATDHDTRKERTLQSFLPKPKTFKLSSYATKGMTTRDSMPSGIPSPYSSRLLKRPQEISKMLESSTGGSGVSSALKNNSKDSEIQPEQADIVDKNNSSEFDLEKAIAVLNDRARELFQDDPLSDGSSRWILEQGFLRGYMACWTITKGAELVAAVAKVVSASGVKRQPDISLQWVGRQLWGLTIQIPRKRSGDVLKEHIELAKNIDQELSLVLGMSTTCYASDITNQSNNSISNQSQSSTLSEQKQPHSLPPPSDEPQKSKTIELPTLLDENNISRSSSSTGAVNQQQLENDQILSPMSNELQKVVTELEENKPLEVIVKSSIIDQASKALSPPDSPTASSTSSTYRSLTGTLTGVSMDYKDPFQKCIPVKTGWLKKKSGRHRSVWNQRWFELKGNRLYYFATETDGIPRAAIILDKIKARMVSKNDDSCCEISITSDEEEEGGQVRIMKFSNKLTHQSYLRKAYVLRAESPAVAKSWVEATSKAAMSCNLSLPLPSDKKTPFTLMDQKQLPRMQRYGSIRYLRETDPLLWELNPIDQMAIKKRSSQARSRSDYSGILSKYAHAVKKIMLPPPRPINMEQTLRDIEPESFLINNVLYGGKTNNNLDLVFEVLESYVKRFTAAHDERVNFVSAILQASARTTGGGDAYFVVRNLLGNPFVIIRPSDVKGFPIEVEISTENPSEITVTIISVFSFHTVKDVDKCKHDHDFKTVKPLLRLRARHVQEFEFIKGKCSRWLKLEVEKKSQ